MERINVLISGLIGDMASTVLRHLKQREDEFFVIPYSLTGPQYGKGSGTVTFNGITLISPAERESRIGEIKKDYPHLIVVDYAASKENPNTPKENAKFYCRHSLPFVMGSTGGNRDRLEEIVENSEISAVIAPNMAPQIVAYQEFMEELAKSFPGLLEGCSLRIIESHQVGKLDTSGTAKAMVEGSDGSPGYFNKLGIPFKKEGIEMIRDESEQLKMGIPKSSLKGHGWHTYVVYSDRENSNLNTYRKKLRRFLIDNKVFSSHLQFVGPERGIFPNEEFTESIIKDMLPEEKDGRRMFFRYSGDRTVGFSLIYIPNRVAIFSHNINGREVYALGTLQATKYLNEKIKEGVKGKVYSMTDVLNS